MNVKDFLLCRPRSPPSRSAEATPVTPVKCEKSMEPLSPELNAGGMGTAPRLQVINRRIHELKMDPRNPRQHSRKQIKQMVLSIKTFGFLVPAVVDANGNVVTGHARILACRELGWSEIPTVLFDSLSEAKRRAYMLADNRLSEHSSWNEQLLAEQLKDLVLGELDFSIEALGWGMPEIELKIASLDEQPAAEDRNDRVPEPVTTPPLSRPGDLWLLGGHRVLCGSALDITALEKLVGDERAAMVFTDPPYNVPIDGYVIGEMSAPASTVFLARSVRNHAAFCFSGSLLYVCMDWRHLEELLAAGRERLRRAEEPLRLGQGQWRDGFAVPQPARAGPGLQDGSDGRIATMSSSADLAATAAMSGTIPGSIPSPATRGRAICWPCTRRSNRWRWSPTRSSTARAAATSCSTVSSAAVRP